MMSKPEPEAAAEEPAAVTEQPKGPSDAVADLERRLAMLGDETNNNDPPPPMEVAEQSFATPPPAAAAAPATGKNALLVSPFYLVSDCLPVIFYIFPIKVDFPSWDRVNIAASRVVEDGCRGLTMTPCLPPRFFCCLLILYC